MIVFLLLVIIAILLFGSSAVTGVIGFVLGFVVLVIAVLLSISVLAMVPAWGWWTIAAIVGTPIIYLFAKQKRVDREIADLTAKADEARRQYEAMKLNGSFGAAPSKGPKTKFHNDGLNAKKRKRLARLAEQATREG